MRSLLPASILLLPACTEQELRAPNVILITVESLRTDHVTCYGGARPSTPSLDALAAEGVVYTDAHAVTSWTLASHASLFTGLYPSAHQVVEPLSSLGGEYWTMAELLAERGYASAAVVSGPYLRRPYHLDQGFESYDDSLAGDSSAPAHGMVTSPGMLEGLRRFLLHQRDPSRPFFLFAYFWDPHYDYIPPAPYDGWYVDRSCTPIDVRGYETRDVVKPGISPAELGFVLAQYDGEIRWTDRHLGAFFRLLRELDLWEETLVVVTADHGEEFFEHGSKGHKRNLYREAVQVPLIVKYPGGEPRGRDGRLASLVDVLPTVLEVTGGVAPPDLDGVSLLAPRPDAGRSILFELESLWYSLAPGGGADRPPQRERWVAVRRGDDKLVAVPADERFELYDVAADPGEQVDIAADVPERVEALRAELARMLEDARTVASRYRTAAPAEVEAGMLEDLRALGYVR